MLIKCKPKRGFNMSKNATVSQLTAEFLGSTILVMTAVSPVILFTYVMEASSSITMFANAIAVAFVLCALIEIFGPISGAHFNPVVTMAMLLDRKINTAKAAMYVLVQFAGGIVGLVLSKLMFLDEVGNLFAVSDTVRNQHVFFGEIFGTFILILAIMLLVQARSQKSSIIVGLLVGGLAMSTSSTMFANPQVTVARMLTNTPSGIRPVDGLVFIAMQIIGTLLAYGVYKLVFKCATP